MDQEVLQDLYERAKSKGYSKSIEEFQQLISSDDEVLNDNFEYVKSKGYTKDISDFSMLVGSGEKKNSNDTSDSNLETEVTEFTIETESQPGSLDSFVEEKPQTTEQDNTGVPEDVELSEEVEYLQNDLNALSQLETATESSLNPGASARARMMREQSRKVDPLLKSKILSDFNISKALEQGFISKKIIDDALRGNKNAIKKLQSLAVESPESYKQKMTDQRLDKTYAFEESSDLVEFIAPEGDDEKKAPIRKKIIAYDAESKRLQDENPNATEEELSAILNRPDDPNFVTDEEYELVEDDFTPTGFEDSDIHMMYDTQKLKSIKGFNVKDFDGYLKEQGYMDRYIQLLDDETISEDGRFYDYSGNYNPTLAAERLKAQYLTNYINNQVERNVEFQILDYQSKNNGRHPSLDGVQLNFSTGVDDVAMGDYVEKQFPSLTAKLKNQDVKNQENYQKYLEGENPWFTQSVKQGWRSVEDRIHSFSKGTYGFIGMNSVADEIRMRDAQDDLERDDFMRYAYASGKKAFYNGREYGIDERGQIYDLDIKKNVTNVLTDAMADSIRKEVAQSDEIFKSFSGSGTVIATTGIASDMLLQIAFTRGVGNVGRGGAALLGNFDKGRKVVSGLSSIPMKGTTASAMIAQGTLFSTNLASSTYDQAIANGIDQATAIELRQKAGAQGFALGSITAPISTQAVAMNKIFGKKGTEKITKGLVDAYQKGGDKGLNAYFQRLQQTVIQNYGIYARESVKEIFQENVQQAGQAFVIGENVNELAKKEIMNNTITGAEYANTTILAGLAGLIMPFGGDLSSVTSKSMKASFNPGAAAIDRLEALHGLSKDVDKTKEFLNSMVTQGVYTEEQVSDLLSDIDIYVNTVNNIPTNLSPETSLIVMQSVNEIQKLEQLKKQRDKSFHPDIDEKIQELRNEITTRTQFDYVNAKGKLKLKDEAARELAKEAEDRGENNFTIDDGAITQRAIDNFNLMDVDEKLKYTDLTKQDLKTDKKQEDAIQKPSTEKQVLPDDAGSKEEGRDSEVGLQKVREGDTQQVTTETEIKEGKTKTDTTSDKTAETDTEQVSILNKSINVTDSRGRKGLVPVSELESFVGENRLGDAAMPNSRETIDKLKEDIKKNGFKEPIVVLYDKFSNGGEATIIEGNHRYAAAKELGLKEIPVTFEKGTIRSNEKRAKDQMFPLNRKPIGKINDTFGVKGSDLGLAVRQPNDADFVKDEVMSVNKELDNKIESFANRIIDEGSSMEYSDEAIQFYSENKEAIDNRVSEKKKEKPKTESKERALAIKIARGDKVFSDADIDLYAASEDAVQAEVEAIANTNSQTITADTYKSILDSIKSTTRRDKARVEGENAQRKRFWKAWNRSAREKKMDLKQKRKSLNDGIKAYAKKRKGTITSAQTRAVINKINNVNLDNPVQVKKVQEYVEKVFADADFANDVDTAIKLSNQTIKKLNSGRLGDNGNFNAAVSQLLTLPISDLDAADVKAYNDLLSKIAKREKATPLDNEMVNEANDLLNVVKSKELETDSELEYDEKKGFIYKEGTKKIIDKILDPDVTGETIIEENSDFIENKLDALDSATLEILVDKINSAENDENVDIVESVNDYAKTRQALIDETVGKSKKIKLNKLTKIAQNQSVGARTLQGLNAGQLALLTGKELSELDVHLDNISEGFYTYYANQLAQRIEGNQRAENMSPMIDKMLTVKGKISTARQRLASYAKNSFGKIGLGSSAAAKQVGLIGQMIRSNPLTALDNMFGNYKNNIIYENSIRPTAEAYARFKNWINQQTDIIDTVESLLAPTVKENINTAVKRRFELTAYLLQKEFESNNDRKGTGRAVEFIDETIAKYNADKNSSRYTKESIDILKKIKEQYSVDGDISLKKMEDNMSSKTKKALELLEGVYSGLGELQSYATRIVRGNEIDLVNNYVHHKATYENQEREDSGFQEAINYLNIKPGTKSKTSFERKGKKSIDFDPITTALRATRNTGLDYFMSNEIATSRKAFAQLKKMSQDNDEKYNAVLDLNKIYDEALGNVISNNMSSNVIGGKFWNSARKIGYYSALASIPRAGAELASNLSFAALSTPKETALGMTKYAALSGNEKGRMVVENVSATVNTKLYSDEALGGSKVESGGVLGKKKSSSQAKSNVGVAYEYAKRNSGVKYIPKVANKVGEILVTKPDQIVSRPLWFGTFATTFKAETGKKVDFDKIADNDSDYMNEYRDAISKATRKADSNVTMAATSNDPFSAVLKNQAQDNESMMNFYRMINGYMSSFSLNEYATARQAIASMVGQGQMSPLKGAATLAGVQVRMTLYVVLLKYLQNAMYGMLGIGDDEDDEDYEELAIRQGVGSATSLISRGVSGNVPMIPVNFGIEALNREYGYDLGLRSEEKYNPFKHSIIYATMNIDNTKENLSKAILLQGAGPFGPQLKSAIKLGELGIRSFTNKTEESRKENLGKLLSSQSAIEVANIFGGVPAYRDIRGGFLREQFKEDETVQPLSLDDLKFYDIQEYNRQMRLKEFNKKNKPTKSREILNLEKELKDLQDEIDGL